MKLPTPQPLKFAKNQDGNATVEMTLWLPFIFAFFLAIGEIALVFYGQSRVLEVAQDATRQASIGRLQTSDELSTYVTNRLAPMTQNAVVQSGSSKGIITTVVSVPMNDLAPFGFFTNLIAANVTVATHQVAEF